MVKMQQMAVPASLNCSSPTQHRKAHLMPSADVRVPFVRLRYDGIGRNATIDRHVCAAQSSSAAGNAQKICAAHRLCTSKMRRLAYRYNMTGRLRIVARCTSSSRHEGSSNGGSSGNGSAGSDGGGSGGGGGSGSSRDDGDHEQGPAKAPRSQPLWLQVCHDSFRAR